jgi:hypothetical protein
MLRKLRQRRRTGWLLDDSTLGALPAQVWALSSRVCRHPLRRRLPVQAGFTKSNMTASAFWPAGMLPAFGWLPAPETISRRAFPLSQWPRASCRCGHA